MKKLYITRIIKFIALLLPIIILIALAQNYLFCFVDHNAQRICDFYKEEENSLDVVFIGASEVFTGFSPAYAYDKYGFTSYLYAMDSNPSSLFKYQVKEVLKSQTPQLIFIEVNGYFEADNADESRLRLFIENIPTSLNKLDAISQFDYDDKLSCLFPIIKYHGDWQDLDDLSYRFKLNLNASVEPCFLKGIVTYTDIDDQIPIYDSREHIESKDITKESEDNLINLLEYCQSEQLDNVIFVRFPHKLVDNYYYNCTAYANKIGEIVSDYGYTYLNLEEKAAEIGIDYLKDFYNNGHLNIYGQIKLTEYLGHLIKNEYQIVPIEQTATNKAHWEVCVQYINAYNKFAYEETEEGSGLWLTEDSELIATLEEIKISTK